MTPQEYLNQIRHIEKEIKCLDHQRRTLNKNIQATEYKHDKTYSNEISRPPEDLLLKMEELDEGVSERQLEWVKLYGQIAREIEEVPYRHLRSLLRYRYVDSLGWKSVAKKMQYTVRNIHNLHKNALKEFKKQHNNKAWK